MLIYDEVNVSHTKGQRVAEQAPKIEVTDAQIAEALAWMDNLPAVMPDEEEALYRILDGVTMDLCGHNFPRPDSQK